MNHENILNQLDKLNVVRRNGHFKLTSGRHSDVYFNKRIIYPYVELTTQLCYAMMSDAFNDDIQTVIGPAVGGIVLSFEIAAFLNHGFDDRTIYSIFAEKKRDGTLYIREEYLPFITGKRVLLVDDVLTTGGSAKQMITRVQDAGGYPVRLCVICNRGGITAEQLGIPNLSQILHLPSQSWDPSECPMCAQGIPLDNNVGHGGIS